MFNCRSTQVYFDGVGNFTPDNFSAPTARRLEEEEAGLDRAEWQNHLPSKCVALLLRVAPDPWGANKHRNNTRQGTAKQIKASQAKQRNERQSEGRQGKASSQPDTVTAFPFESISPNSKRILFQNNHRGGPVGDVESGSGGGGASSGCSSRVQRDLRPWKILSIPTLRP